MKPIIRKLGKVSINPIKRYWRAKVDGTWRGWIEL